MTDVHDDLPLVATGLPPGWIELAAFADDATMRAFLDAQLDVDADAMTAEQRTLLVDACVAARHVVVDAGWLQVGGIVTNVPDDHGESGDRGGPSLRTTAWAIAVGLLDVPRFGDLNPVGVAERVLGRTAEVEVVEPFTLDDGRDGVALATTATVETTLLPLDLGALAARAGAEPPAATQTVSACVYLLPLTGLPGRLGVVVGTAPHLDERPALSVVAGQMAVSMHVVEDVSELRPGHVLVDTTRQVHPAGFLTADAARGAAHDTADEEARRGPADP